MDNISRLWDKKEESRNAWREDRENLELQYKFGKSSEEYRKEWLLVLEANNIDVTEGGEGDIYIDIKTKSEIDKEELYQRLKQVLSKEFLEKIRFDL